MDNLAQAENSNTETQTPEAEKQTNRTFTQSEVDSMVGSAIGKTKGDYADYGDIKKELDALKATKIEADRNEMSELEKTNSILKEIKEENARLTNLNMEHKKSDSIASVLSDSKYKNLPRAYKRMVEYSEISEEMIKSADAALNEYTAEFGNQVKDTFGIPNTTTLNTPVSTGSIGEFQSALKAKIANKLNRK